MIGRPSQENVYGYFWFQPKLTHCCERASNDSLQYKGETRLPRSFSTVRVRASVSTISFMGCKLRRAALGKGHLRTFTILRPMLGPPTNRLPQPGFQRVLWAKAQLISQAADVGHDNRRLIELRLDRSDP